MLERKLDEKNQRKNKITTTFTTRTYHLTQHVRKKNSDTARDLESIFGKAAACSVFGELIGEVIMVIDNRNRLVEVWM